MKPCTIIDYSHGKNPINSGAA